MDPITNAVFTIAPLIGLFNNVVDTFEYIQIGRNFERNFQTSLLRLDAAKLQLSRWGEAMGLGPDSSGAQFRAVADEELAKRILSNIQSNFTKAQRKSEEFKGKNQANERALAVYDPETELDATASSLSARMRKLAIRRHGSISLGKKMKWALYDHRDFDWLVANITTAVADLIKLFPPASQERSQQLCVEEVVEAKEANALELLEAAAPPEDKDLHAALQEALKQRRPGNHYSVTFTGDHNHGIQIGQQLGTGSVNYYAGHDTR